MNSWNNYASTLWGDLYPGQGRDWRDGSFLGTVQLLRQHICTLVHMELSISAHGPAQGSQLKLYGEENRVTIQVILGNVASIQAKEEMTKQKSLEMFCEECAVHSLSGINPLLSIIL